MENHRYRAVTKEQKNMDFLLSSKQQQPKKEEGTKKERQRQDKNHANIQGQRSKIGSSRGQIGLQVFKLN